MAHHSPRRPQTMFRDTSRHRTLCATFVSLIGCSAADDTVATPTPTAPMDPADESAFAGDAGSHAKPSGESHTPRGPDPEPPAVVGEPSAVETLAGEYAARVVYQQEQTLDVGFGVGGTLLNTTTAYDRVTLEADGRYVEQPCDVQLDSQDGDGNSALFVADVTLNPELFARLPPQLRRLEFDGTRWELPLASQAIGWRAEGESPADEPLPESADDPRVVDEDGDGNPGVTTTLGGNLAANGDLYVTQLKRNRMVGTVEDGLLVGEVFDSGEQRVLGGTAPMASQTLVPAGDARTNRVVLVPLSEPLDCAALLAQANRLFPPHPVFD